MNRAVAIAGIHTGIGKTIASAVLAEAMGADYWKPVQAGVEERDALTVQGLITDGPSQVHGEAIILSQPLSPHAAAAIDDVTVDYRKFTWPATDKLLLVETAGGLISPISANETMADFISHFQLPTILVTQNYLGSINHTLLTIEVMRARGIHVLGIVVNGDENTSSETFIEQYGGVPVIARIPFFETLTPEAIYNCAITIKQTLVAGLKNSEDIELAYCIKEGRETGYAPEEEVMNTLHRIQEQG